MLIIKPRALVTESTMNVSGFDGVSAKSREFLLGSTIEPIDAVIDFFGPILSIVGSRTSIVDSIISIVGSIPSMLGSQTSIVGPRTSILSLQTSIVRSIVSIVGSKTSILDCVQILSRCDFARAKSFAKRCGGSPRSVSGGRGSLQGAAGPN
jgi:hypothetical protein